MARKPPICPLSAPFSPSNETLAAQPTPPAVDWSTPEPCRQALELRLVASYLLADARLLGSSRSDQFNHFFRPPPPRPLKKSPPSELPRPLLQALHHQGEHTPLESLLSHPRSPCSSLSPLLVGNCRCLRSPEQLRRPSEGGAATTWCAASS
jgi:hypothetical protein